MYLLWHKASPEHSLIRAGSTAVKTSQSTSKWLNCETNNYHHFQYYATFLFKTLLCTLQYASVNHTLYGKCVMLPQLIELEGIKMAPNYPVNLRWRVLYWLVRGFRVVDVARILHVWQIFVNKFRHFFRTTEIPARWIILCGGWY